MRHPVLFVIAAVSLVAVACGGGSDNKTPTAAATQPGAGASATATPGVPTTPRAAASSTATVAPAPTTRSGLTLSAADATKLVNAAAVMPADVGADWTVMSDTTADNAQAAATDPTGGASFERCGRLLGRTLVSQPKDVVSAFLAGEPVAVFSALNVYATEAGAADCAAENGVRLQQPGELAKAFGSVFIDPLAVTIQPVEYPQVGDGSFAAILTGTINASGTQVDLSILVVAYRLGNVTVAIGSAHSAGSIPASEVTPYVNLVNQRIAANR